MTPSLPRLHLPMTKPEDVISHLGKPTHWKQGRSAKSVADAWFGANDVPVKVRAVLDQDPSLAGAALVDAFLERCTDLGDGRGSPTQTDLFALLGTGAGLVSFAVEAKVDESFGPFVAEWVEGGGDGKTGRLAGLCALFGLEPDQVGDLRYQLLHRTAAGILEARRYRTGRAVMMVHSFCPKDTGLADFLSFAGRLGFSGAGRDQLSERRDFGGITLQLGWANDEPLPGFTGQYRSLEWVTDFGRTRLSRSFFMRDFLFSEIAMMHGMQNLPSDPDLAIETGTRLCEELLEPLQDTFGRIAVRSAFRSAEVNGFGNVMQRKGRKGYSCASNEANAAGHIWDLRDAGGGKGATACIVVPGIWDRFGHETGGWRRLAWWIHDHLPYSSLEFFPTRWAFNITWHDRPVRRIDSFVEPRGCLTRPGMDNHEGSHEPEWRDLVAAALQG